jgi:H+/Na+-translocating ferredoxin:NAD+ oxidoreductase subunit G
MNDILKITLNLVAICAVAGLLVSATWSKTEPVKLAKEAKEREEALKGLMPDADNIKKVKDIVIEGKEGTIYRAEKSGKITGYVVSSVGRGYSSFIRMLVAVNTDNVVTGIDILGHGETPGLGDQISEDWFKDRFKGKSLEHLVVVKHETDTDVQAISGATISSRGVTKGVRAAVETLIHERESGLDQVPDAAAAQPSAGTQASAPAAAGQ